MYFTFFCLFFTVLVLSEVAFLRKRPFNLYLLILLFTTFLSSKTVISLLIREFFFSLLPLCPSQQALRKSENYRRHEELVGTSFSSLVSLLINQSLLLIVF